MWSRSSSCRVCVDCCRKVFFAKKKDLLQRPLCLSSFSSSALQYSVPSPTPPIRDLNKIITEMKVDVSKLSEINGWEQLWANDFSPWQESTVNPKLANFHDVAVEACGKDSPSQIRFFVPLCGKTPDLKFLYDKGFHVVGCEGVEKACIEFFEENGMEYSRKEVDCGLILFQNSDKRLEIFCGDYFALTPKIIGGGVDCVWDRGSFVAVDVTQRKQYSEVMEGLLNNSFGYLLASLEREFEEPNMMPHSASFQDSTKFFGGFCSIKILDQKVNPGSEGSGYIKNNLFMFTRKPAGEDRLDYWQDRWTRGESQWHQGQPNEYLVKYLDLLKNGKDTVRIFFPLCGKTLDLVWLYNLGHTVVGLEGTVFVAEQVFTDAKLEYTKTYLKGVDGVVFKTKDERLTVFCCDFFQTTQELVGKFDAVFDRGAFEAIDEVDRERYADVMFNILEKDFRYLLQGSEYEEEVFKGPPRCVPRQQVYKLFERTFAQDQPTTVTILEEADITESGRQRFKIEGTMTKLVYSIEGN